MNDQRSLAFFGAHPDDESFGPGSTLAKYSISGAKVYYVCSTKGEAGTVAPEHMKGYKTIAELRAAELQCAAKAFGLAGLFQLGYRDSGMRGLESNKHPECLAMAPMDEVVGRMVKVIRQIKPQVMVTHDAGGGYGHPDHVATHEATVQAFHAAADPKQYPEAGHAFQPRKLYFVVRPRGMMKMMIRLMPLFGQNPHEFGRNKDIDLTKMVGIVYPYHAVIRLPKAAIELRNKAAACHTSQGGGRFGPGLFRILRLIESIRGQRDYFMRAYPPPSGRRKEKDLFAGISK
jgi:N-acetyl-1-D-myo-inositol-2-amino-2-deoxy-alpha-D-glucopyranoside deacetylase